MNFFGALLDLKSENLKLEKGRQNPDAFCQKISATEDVLWCFGFSKSEEQKSVFGQQTHKLVFLSLEAIIGTETKTKRYKGLVTEVTSPKTQRNKKETEGKNKMGCLP